MSDSLKTPVVEAVPSEAQEVFFEQLKVYLARARAAAISAPAAVLLLAFIQSREVGWGRSLAWLILPLIFDFLTIYTSRCFERHPPELSRLNFWRYRQHLLHLCAGLAWGSAAWFFYIRGNVVGELLTYAFLAAVTASDVTFMSPFRTGFALFSTCIWLPVMALMLWVGDTFLLQLALGVIILLTVNNYYAWVANQQLLDGLRQTVRNRRLCQELALAREELHHANVDLEARNAALHEASEQLRSMALHDELTSTYNRRFLYDEMAKEIAMSNRYGTPTTLLLVDLDWFKRVNDRHGHLVGDAVLKEVVMLLQSRLRDTDTLSRFGGEEFVINLRMTSGADALILAERLRTLIEEHAFSSLPAGEHLTISIGVAECRAGDDIDRWLNRADSACYEAKSTGRNRVVLFHKQTPEKNGTAIGGNAQ
ncbi:MAG: Response regulator PleD [Betaproteobacteria bacterium ADurb.Bin341]|nr:MAG: Response regulator PleD [Betaproteobacteria bacterium ADurb.Bin341]